MKRALTEFLTAAGMFCCIASASAETVTKNYDFKDFKTLEVSNFFDVTMTKSSEYSVNITVSEEYEKYLDIVVKNGSLSVAFKNLPAKLSALQVGKIAKAEISMPELDGLTMSGASKFTSEDLIDLGRGVFNLSLSGAAQVNNINVNASEARMYLSGASRCSLSGEYVELHFSVSGTSRAEVNATADDLDIKSSGTAVMEIEGEYDEVSLNTSGVANITMKGKAEEMTIKGTGTSGIDVTELVVDSADVTLGGAAVAKVNVKKNLKASLDGTSRCSYMDYNTLKITESVARAAKLKTL